MLVALADSDTPTGPRVIVMLAAKEIAAILDGHTERFELPIKGRPTTIELLALGNEPTPGPAPDVRLRVQTGALRAALVSTVTPVFADVPFTLELMCTDAPKGPVEIEPGVTVGPPARPAPAGTTVRLRDRLIVAAIPLGGILMYKFANHGGDGYYLLAVGMAVFAFVGANHA